MNQEIKKIEFIYIIFSIYIVISIYIIYKIFRENLNSNHTRYYNYTYFEFILNMYI